MHLQLVSVTLLICVSQLYFPCVCWDFYSYIIKALYDCHAGGHRGMSVTGFAIMDAQEVLYRRHLSCTSSMIHRLQHCVQDHWMHCTQQHNLSTSRNHGKASLHHRPCYHGNLQLHYHDFTLDIKVHPVFQINLTFTYFHLQHGSAGCHLHNVRVSGKSSCYYGDHHSLWPTDLR